MEINQGKMRPMKLWVSSMIMPWANTILKSILSIVIGIALLKICVSEQVDTTFTDPGLLSWQAVFGADLFLGTEGYPVDWGIHLTNLAITSTIVFLGLMISSIISLGLGYQMARRPKARGWHNVGNALTLVSGFPMFVVGLILFSFVAGDLTSLVRGMLANCNSAAGDTGSFGCQMLNFFMGDKNDFRDTAIYHVLILLTGGLIIGTCEGALGELSRMFRAIFAEIQNRTYFLAYQARGQSTLDLLYRQVGPFLWKSLGTRISYLFGGAVIVEKALNIDGLGNLFFSSLQNAAGVNDYQNAMVSGLIILTVPLLIRTAILMRFQLHEYSGK